MITLTPMAQLNATVILRRELSPGLFEIWIRPDEGIPDFLPGQYVALGLPESHEGGEKEKLVKRAYSIASSPERKDALEFYIAEVTEGQLSPRLARLNEGERIFVQRKYVGTFTLESVPAGSDLVFVATGTGIAPFVSMLRTHGTIEKYSSLTLLHGVRYSADLAYRDELLELQSKRGEKFRYYATVSREGPPKWSGEHGYVQKFFTEGKVSVAPETHHLFLCGNPAMIEEVCQLLEGQGFKEHTKKQPGNIHFEKYW